MILEVVRFSFGTDFYNTDCPCKNCTLKLELKNDISEFPIVRKCQKYFKKGKDAGFGGPILY